MTNFLNNCVIQLFDYIEATCGVKFVQFTDSDLVGRYQGDEQQEYMAAYRQSSKGTVYKYLYDPGLSFNFRFHQYLSDILFVHRDKPWVTLMFSTGPVRPLTYVLSHKYDGVEFVYFPDDEYHEGEVQDIIPYKTRRVLVPMQVAVISNNISYLYETLEKMASHFDRFINFPYNQTIKYADNKIMQWQVIGQCTNISQVDIQKLDTETRGTVVMGIFNFNLVHWITDTPEAPLKLLEHIILEIRADRTDGPLIYTETIE